MYPATKAPPASVYLLADNLDAALAAGEDLLKSCVTWHAGNSRAAEEVAARRIEERRATEAIRTLEMIAVARVLKSRERAAELAREDANLKPIAKLYEGGTALLLDDAQVVHETTPIQKAGARGLRDTLVLTFRADRFQAP